MNKQDRIVMINMVRSELRTLLNAQCRMEANHPEKENIGRSIKELFRLVGHISQGTVAPKNSED